MRRLGLPPKVLTLQNVHNDDWFSTVGERLNVYSGAVNPVVSEVPENQWIVYHNTGAGEVRIWTNIAGILLKSAAFT